MSSIRVLLATAALLAAAGCAAPTYEHAAGLGVTPTEQHPVQTTMAPVGIQLSPHDFGLSQNQAMALKDLAHGWSENREGMVVIEAPEFGGLEVSATAYAARDALESFGVPRGAIDLIGYRDGGPNAPIRISHLARQAKIENCGRNWTDLTKTAANQPTANFGCSVNANIASMIANPADIDNARGRDPVDAGRRQTVINKYREGAVTSSDKDDQADGTISQAVN